MKHNTRIIFRLPTKDAEIFKRLAKQNKGKGASSVLRRLVRQYIRRHQRGE